MFRFIKKGLSLRIVNFVGLTVTVVSLVLSIVYIRHERSYDRHHSKAERIVRLSLKEEGESLDVRIYGNMIYPLLEQIPEIESKAKIFYPYTTDLEYKGMHYPKYENVCFVNEDFFDVFDIEFIETEEEKFDGDNVFFSVGYEKYLASEASEDSMVGKGVKMNIEPFRVAGTYKDFPETSHFRADALVYRPGFDEMEVYSYIYLLLKEGTDLEWLSRKITEAVAESGAYDKIYAKPVKAVLMPLTDIHLYSNNIRELDQNGNVIYIYLIIFANVLLLLIVLFNLILNWSLILIDNEKVHRVNWILGSKRSYWLVRTAKWLNADFGKSAKWVFIVQYSIVTLILVLTVGMGRQMDMVSRIQPGGDSVAVVSLPSDAVEMKLPVFKEELGKSSFVKSVTSSFLLPGKAIRDAATIEVEGLDESVDIPLFVVGENFLPFFNLKLLAGEDFGELELESDEEFEMMLWKLLDGSISDRSEGYIINQSAIKMLGFNDASDAIGKMIRTSHEAVSYINHGRIIGVVEDFYYTGTLNETEPIIMMQRNNFQHYVLIDLTDIEHGKKQIRDAWKKVYPDYTLSDLKFMDEIYDDIYSDERTALGLMRAFAIICFIITDLGLIVFMAYIVKRRRREIALRKVNGATSGNIVTMLNLYYLKYILIAFAVAAPLAYWLLDRWLQSFAYRIAIGWWMFALAALTLILISAASVSIQSYRAALANPLDGIKEN